jgi:ligand-binding sensor domain-containing protein
LRTMWVGCVLLYCGASSIVPAKYLFDVPGIDNKLPHNLLFSVTATHDGCLWFSVFNGLAQYDMQGEDVNMRNRRGVR